MKRKNVAATLLAFILLSGSIVFGQEAKKLYDPSIDGMKQIKEAISSAKSSGKHILIQYGGNWCPWCIKFDAFCKDDPEISKLVSDNYIPVKLNYSPENKNEDANLFLGNPTRFGFPVLIIVDGKGRILHIQDSGLLEEGQGYNKEKVKGFFRNWTVAALVPLKPVEPKK
jgi:hypothetical protein